MSVTPPDERKRKRCDDTPSPTWTPCQQCIDAPWEPDGHDGVRVVSQSGGHCHIVPLDATSVEFLELASLVNRAGVEVVGIDRVQHPDRLAQFEAQWS
jgi:hypothetical protein